MIICPNCGKQNEDRHKFCLGCGARLPATAQPAAPPPPPGRSPSVGTQPGNLPAAEGWGAPPPGIVGSGAPPPPPPPRPAGAPPRGAPPPAPRTGAGGQGVPPVRSQPPPAPPTAARPPGPATPPPSPRPTAATPPPKPSSGSVAQPLPRPPVPVRAEPPAAPPTPALPEGYVACGSCAFANPPGFAFCGRCGSKLVLEVAPPVEEDVGSAQTVFVEQASEEFRQLREQARSAGLVDAPPPIVMAEPAAAIGPAARLIMLGPDGSPIGERVLAPGETLPIGRAEGTPWDEDAYLDGHHGSLTPLVEGIRAEDHDSLNGIYVKLVDRTEIQSGDQFRVGQELLLYEDLPEPTPTEDGTERMGSPNPGYWGRLSLLVEPSVASQAYAIEGEGITIGREVGDITFPHDGYVSGSHCRIVGDDAGVFLEDLGSSNGTYMRVRSGAILPYGSLVLIGQKLFQLEQA